MPKVTVCIPAYNAEHLISRTIDSVLKQTHKDVDVVVVDDASTDSTPEIVRSYMAKEPRVTLRQHTQNSGGCGLAVKEMLSECTSPYFCWIAADDEMYPEYIELLVDYLSAHDSVGYVYSDFTLIDTQGVPAGTWTFPLTHLPDYIRKVLYTLSGALPMNGVFRISSVRDLNLDWLLYRGESASSDTISGIHFRASGLEVARVPAPLFRYRLHATNLTKNADVRAKSNARVLDYILEHHPDICIHEAARYNTTPQDLHTRILTAANSRLLR